MALASKEEGETAEMALESVCRSLDEEQQRVVETNGAILVEAPLGTGKTTALKAKAEARPGSLVLTFTRFARENAGPSAATFHSFCHTLLGRPPVLGRGEQQLMVERALQEIGAAPARSRQWCRTLDLARRRGVGDPMLLELLNAYTRVKGEALDYHDLLEQGLEVLREERPSYFTNVMVDEFQDLNELQYQILLALRPKNLTVFGDPCQTIYGWRDAYPEIFDRFRGDFQPQELPLRTMHRCSVEVVAVLEAMYPRELTGVGRGKAILYTCPPQLEEEVVSRVVREAGSAAILCRTWRGLNNFSSLPGAYYTVDTENEYERIRHSSRKPGKLPLSTVHSYKGLERETVVIAKCDNGMIPWYGTGVVEEEEKRLLYTACGRARKNLVVVSTGGTSIFLDGLPLEVRELWPEMKSQRGITPLG